MIIFPNSASFMVPYYRFVSFLPFVRCMTKVGIHFSHWKCTSHSHEHKLLESTHLELCKSSKRGVGRSKNNSYALSLKQHEELKKWREKNMTFYNRLWKNIDLDSSYETKFWTLWLICSSIWSSSYVSFIWRHFVVLIFELMTFNLSFYVCLSVRLFPF